VRHREHRLPRVVQELAGQQHAHPRQDAAWGRQVRLLGPAQQRPLGKAQRGGQVAPVATLGHHLGGGHQQGARAAGQVRRERALQQALQRPPLRRAQTPRDRLQRVFLVQGDDLLHPPLAQRAQVPHPPALHLQRCDHGGGGELPQQRAQLRRQLRLGAV
ncbi:MAG: hypothetical protein AVDCRST_MAG68-4519, partial [uncultured Gemmatimonadetes bacterium]